MTEIPGPVAARQDSPLRGALWMAATAASFAGAVTVVRYASTELHPFELAFFRSLFATLFVLPLMALWDLTPAPTPYTVPALPVEF